MKKLFLTALMALAFSVQSFSDQAVNDLSAKAKANWQKFIGSVKGLTVTTDRAIMYFKGDKSRVEAVSGQSSFLGKMPGIEELDLRTVMIFTPKENWIISSFTGKQPVPGGANSRYMFERFWWELDTKDAVLEKTENVEGRECEKIVFPLADKLLPVKAVWVDKKNFMAVKDELSAGKYTMITWFSDFRTVKGLFEYAFAAETEISGKRGRTYTVEKIDYRKEVPDELFDPDKVDIQEDEAGKSKMMEMLQKMMKDKDSMPGSGE